MPVESSQFPNKRPKKYQNPKKNKYEEDISRNPVDSDLPYHGIDPESDFFKYYKYIEKTRPQNPRSPSPAGDLIPIDKRRFGRPSRKNPSNGRRVRNKFKGRFYDSDRPVKSSRFEAKRNKKEPEYNPLAGVDKDFIWDGTKQNEINDKKRHWGGSTSGHGPLADKKILKSQFPFGGISMGRRFSRKANKKLDEFDPLAGVDKDFIWDGTKQPNSDKDETRHDKRNRDVPRFEKIMRSLRGKTEPSFDGDDWQRGEKFDARKRFNAKGFNRPRFSADKNRGRFEDELKPEWDDEDFEKQRYGEGGKYSGKRSGPAFGRKARMGGNGNGIRLPRSAENTRFRNLEKA